MRSVLVLSLMMTLLGGCAKLFIPQECRDVTSKDGLTYRYCETASSISVERLTDVSENSGAPRPLLDDLAALEVIRRDAFGQNEPRK